MIALIELSMEELAALQAVFAGAARVDWDAYERAKARIQGTKVLCPTCDGVGIVGSGGENNYALDCPDCEGL